MSKEATSWSGTILGSSDYWKKLSHDTLFSDVTTQRPNYRMALTRLGHRASDAIDAIYGDLNELAGKIRVLPSEDRNALAKQVQSLYDVCKMGGVSAHRADDCVQGLSLSFMSPWSRNIPDPRAVEKAIEAIKLSPFSTRDRAALLLEAGHWGVNSAAGRDEKKRLLLQAIANLDHSSNFLAAVAEEYRQQTESPKYSGCCGPSKVCVAFVLEDTYDFDNFRVVYGDEGHYIMLNIDPGPLANDAGLLSQANGVINTYDIHIQFSKTIDLEG